MSTSSDPIITAQPKRRRVRRLVTVLVILLALGSAGWGYWIYSHRDSDGETHYVTAAVDRGKVERIITATGTVNPVKTVQVGTYVSGPIQAIDVDFNSPVKKGQRVAKIDAATFIVKVRQAEGNLANAEARVQKDRADLVFKKLQLERNQELLTRKLIAQNDLDTARSNYDQADAQLAVDLAGIKQAQASLEESQVNFRYTEILSPVDGVVVSRNVDVGQTVAASFQTPTLFLIAEDLTKMQVDSNVSEADVGNVSQGQHATFSVDAYPGEMFRAEVAQVRNAPLTVANVVTYDVVVAVDNPDLKLKPGMTANVSITTAKRDNVLRVPLRALRFRPESTKEGAKPAAPGGGRGKAEKAAEQPTVYVVGGDGSPRAVPVQVGIRDSQSAEVLGGELKDGDQVAVALQRDASAAPAAGAGKPPSFAGGRRF